MALVIKKVLCVYECKHKNIQPKEGGAPIENFNCVGIDENGNVFRFSSPIEVESHDIENFDEDFAESYVFKVSEWDGKKKYRLIAP